MRSTGRQPAETETFLKQSKIRDGTVTAALEVEIRAASDIVRDLPVTQAWDGLNAEGQTFPSSMPAQSGRRSRYLARGPKASDRSCGQTTGGDDHCVVRRDISGGARSNLPQIPLGAWVGRPAET